LTNTKRDDLDIRRQLESADSARAARSLSDMPVVRASKRVQGCHRSDRCHQVDCLLHIFPSVCCPPFLDIMTSSQTSYTHRWNT